MPYNFPYTKDSHKKPTKAECDTREWPLYQTSFSAAGGYQALYDNYENIADAFAEFWHRVAKRFAKNDNVIGYDLINEPFLGQFWTAPWLLIPGWADFYNLQPFYQRVAKRIREVDEEHIIFFGNSPLEIWPSSVGFTEPVGGDVYANRSALSYHYYTPPNYGMDNHFEHRMHDVKRLRVGGFLSEFNLNAVVGDVVLFNGTAEEMTATMDKCDEHIQSWTGWQYKPFVQQTGYGFSVWFPNGTKNEKVYKAVSRVYAQAISGHAQKMHFDTNTLEFNLEFLFKSTGSATEIFYNTELHYKNGFTLTMNTDKLSY